MRQWNIFADEASELFCPVGLQPVDDLTGMRPVGRLQVWLDAFQDGLWQSTGVSALITMSGVITWPALGRMRAPLDKPARHYRARVDAQYYIPRYRRDQDGIEFDAMPYDDSHPPASMPARATPLVLLPSPCYPFPGHLTIWRGAVVDATGKPVPDAEVSIAATRRALTDARGCFALPAPRLAAPAAVLIDAADLRAGRVGGIKVQFPQDVGSNVQIVIS